MTIRPKTRKGYEIRGEKWKPCVMCRGAYKRVELVFTSGSTEPTVDETLTGATSGDTGKVAETATVYTGSWAGGDAAGYVVLYDHTLSGSGGNKWDGSWGTTSELINGSTGGNDMMTGNGTFCAGAIKQHGRFYPKGEMVEYKGKWLCNEHFKMRSVPELRDETRIRLDEGDRGKE